MTTNTFPRLQKRRDWLFKFKIHEMRYKICRKSQCIVQMMRVQRCDAEKTRRVEARRGRGTGARPTSRWDRASRGYPAQPGSPTVTINNTSPVPWCISSPSALVCARPPTRAHRRVLTCTDAGGVDAVLHCDLGGVHYDRNVFPNSTKIGESSID